MGASPNSERSERPPVILFGLGFTTQRLARRLLFRRMPVYAAARHPERYTGLFSLGLQMADLPQNAVLVNTVPPVSEAENGHLNNWIKELKPQRLVYISSTGIYGRQTYVDAKTEPDPSSLKAQPRITQESWVRAGDWHSLVIRPAAIYGPGRGVHVRIARGEAPRAFGAGIVSRIHVEDLAGVLEAAVTSDLEGSWPLADDMPCSSDEINGFCARLLRMPLNARSDAPEPTGRTVDGTEIRKLLGVSLTYPNYQAGILADVMPGRLETGG